MQALDGIAKACAAAIPPTRFFLLTDKKETQTQRPAKRLPSRTRRFRYQYPRARSRKTAGQTESMQSVTRAISARTISAKKFASPDNNKQDTKDLLAYDTYELVGICESPLYLNFERGSTSLATAVATLPLYTGGRMGQRGLYRDLCLPCRRRQDLFRRVQKKMRTR